jgi:hypothetical protein
LQRSRITRCARFRDDDATAGYGSKDQGDLAPHANEFGCNGIQVLKPLDQPKRFEKISAREMALFLPARPRCPSGLKCAAVIGKALAGCAFSA